MSSPVEPAFKPTTKMFLCGIKSMPISSDKYKNNVCHCNRWNVLLCRSQKASYLNSTTDSPSEKERCPLVDALVDRGSRHWESPFHVPGHKRGARLSPTQKTLVGVQGWQHDATELEGLDNLQNPTGVIREAMEKASVLWNADHTWFLVNGATVGIHAAIMATCHRGSKDCVILARNAHQSAHNGVVLAGCNVVYVMPECAYGMAHHVTPGALRDAFERAVQAGFTPRAALIVSPTYFGVQSDIASLSHICSEYQVPLIVDEAHGAHLAFLPAPATDAVQQGANLVIQSTHKQLSGLTQSSMLHAKNISSDLQKRIDTVLRILQSSSPSYLLMGSLDAARQQMEDGSIVNEPHAAAMHIHDYFNNKHSGTLSSTDESFNMSLLSWMLPKEETHSPTSSMNHKKSNVSSFDPWRITLVLHGLGKIKKNVTGWNISELLEKERGIVAEMATENAIVYACGIGTTLAHAIHLTESLDWLVQDGVQRYETTPCHTMTSDKDPLWIAHPSIMSQTPRHIFQSECEPVPLSLSESRISAETITSYPPGIPILARGEFITKDHIEYITRIVQHTQNDHQDSPAPRLTGALDSSLEYITCLCIDC